MMSQEALAPKQANGALPSRMNGAGSALDLKQLLRGALDEYAAEKWDRAAHRAAAAMLPGSAYLAFDTDRVVRCARGAALEAAGWRPEQIEGKTPEQSLPPEEAARVAPMYARALAGESFQMHFRSMQGFDFLARVGPILADGVVLGGAILLIDPAALTAALAQAA